MAKEALNTDIAQGLELMLEGVNMYETTLQLVHPEVAEIYSDYASVVRQIVSIRMRELAAAGKDTEAFSGHELGTALKLQRQAVMVAERTLGLHHYETLSYYTQLVQLELLASEGNGPLRLYRHILHLWDIIYGKGEIVHPEVLELMVCTDLGTEWELY